MFLHQLLQCACPPAAAITTIPTDNCLERVGQIQKIGIQRTKDGATENIITIATTNPNVLATWTGLKGATDNTKVQFTPFIQEPTSEAGEAREYGGGNATLNGIPIILGSNPSPFEAKLIDIRQDIAEALKGYMCEKELSVFLVTADKVWGLANDVTNVTTFKGIPIQSFFVSDKVIGGYEEVDYNMVKWSFAPNWSDKLYGVTPTDFTVSSL